MNLSSGSGRQTLPDTWDDVTVEISTTWSNGDVATDTSTCNVPVTAISITAPNNFKYNQISVVITAANVPEGVTLSGVSLTDGTTTKNISSGNYSYSSGVITVGLVGEDLPVTWNNTSITISTVWSNGSTADDTSLCEVTIIWDTRYSISDMFYPDDENTYYFKGLSVSGVTVSEILNDGNVWPAAMWWDDEYATDPTGTSNIVVDTDVLSYVNAPYTTTVRFTFTDGTALEFLAEVKVE